MDNTIYLKHIISINNLTRTDLDLVLKTAAFFKLNSHSTLLHNKIIASCFFESSTRTRLSFESAIYRLGASVIGFSDGSDTSMFCKGESFADTIKVISSYVNAIIIRHPQSGSAKLAADISGNVPVINAGDGTNQHPTQTLTDLFTIQSTQHRLNNLNIAMVGDLKYGRTVHSLAEALSKYEGNRFFLLSPRHLSMPLDIINMFKAKKCSWSFHNNLEEVISKLDIIYMTRIQKERLISSKYANMEIPFILHVTSLLKAKTNMKILHPLPRLKEIPIEVDKTPYAWYFQQASNGLYVRQAILALVLTSNCFTKK
ncbi:MAG: aspartate carbamoyltransferase [Candidatus Dasytiphilus stammeri]